MQSTYGAVLLSFEAAVPIRHLAVVAFRGACGTWKDSYG